MQIGPFEFPDDLYYDREHNWARVEGNRVTQGLTSFGQDIAGEILYADLPRVGREVKQGDSLSAVESGKWVGRIRALVSGRVSAANQDLADDSTLMNSDPYGAGWLAQIEMADPAELENLMRAGDPAFAEFMAAERAKYNK